MTDPEMEAVADLLRAAASSLILPRFGALASHDVHEKSSPDDLVTIADREAELWLTRRLRNIVDCEVVGEEACAAAPDLRKRATADKAWTVDPVDGTGNFVKGKPNFCTMVAFLEHGTPIRSWIWVPLQATLYFAKSGEGLFGFMKMVLVKDLPLKHDHGRLRTWRVERVLSVCRSLSVVRFGHGCAPFLVGGSRAAAVFLAPRSRAAISNS